MEFRTIPTKSLGRNGVSPRISLPTSGPPSILRTSAKVSPPTMRRGGVLGAKNADVLDFYKACNIPTGFSGFLDGFFPGF